MVRIPAVYAPDATISMTSVQQFCEERNAIIMFLQDGAIGLRLNPDIINYLNKIREIAIKNNLVLITSNVNHNKLYELENTTTYNKNISLYKHHYNDMLTPASYATFYQSAEFGQIADVVRFFHEAWGHPSRELMCFIIKNQIFKNIPFSLTERVVIK